MRFSCIAVTTLALTSSSLAAPFRRNFFSSIQNTVNGVINGNATLSGIASTVVQSIENPALTAGLGDAQVALSQVNSQASTSGNQGVSNLVPVAQSGLTNAHDAVNNIGQTLLSGNKPLRSDQKTVAVGIKAVNDAVNQMPAAVNPIDSTLSSDIADAQLKAQNLLNDGLKFLNASGVTFGELGLPDNFATS